MDNTAFKRVENKNSKKIITRKKKVWRGVYWIG